MIMILLLFDDESFYYMGSGMGTRKFPVRSFLFICTLRLYVRMLCVYVNTREEKQMILLHDIIWF